MNDKIKDQVSEWQDDRIQFSAYDITVALRNSGVRISHSLVKQVVHDLYTNGEMDPGYERTLTSIPGTNQQAFVYHHLTDDVNDYEPVKKTYDSGTGGTATATAPSATAVKPSTVTRIGIRNKQPVNDVLSTAYPKYDGSLTIPAILVKKAGLFNKGYRIVEENGCTIVTSVNSTKVGDDHPCRTNSVIVVYRKNLRHLNKGVYKVSLKGDDIYVE